MKLTPDDLKNLPAAAAADLAALAAMRINEDVVSAAMIKILEGKPLQNALLEGKGETWHRQYSTHAARLDDPSANFSNTLFAGCEEEEEVEKKTRTAAGHIESLLSLLARGVEANGKILYGSAALAHVQKVGIRRAQQTLKALKKMLVENRGDTAIQPDFFWGGEK